MTGKKKVTKKTRSAKRGSSAKRTGRKKSSRSLMATATNDKNTVRERVAAIAQAPLAVCESDDNLQSMLRVLRDKDEPITVRLAALQSLQAASFSVIAFESCRSDYIATLREVAEDTDSELRQRALGILAREKDGFAQKKLLEGLEDPLKALVPPEKALQLLSYDVHAAAYSVAREIVKDPPSDIAKREALRLLAADSTAAPLFERTLQDKSESAEIRQISASALHALRPERLQARAREIVMDQSEPDEIRATSLTALTEFGDDSSIAADQPLLDSVHRLGAHASPKVKQHARRLLRKYGQ